MLLSLVFLVVVVVLVTAVRRSRKAVRDDEIRFLCPQYGLEYLDEIPLSRLGPLETPPWTAFLFGLDTHFARQTMVAERPGGTLFAANFEGRLYRGGKWDIDAARTPPETCSIVGLVLREPQAQGELIDFCLALRPKNGLRIVVRRDTIYAMFGPRMKRSMEMSYREQIKCMSAMLRLLEGNPVRAGQLFEEVPSHSLARLAVNLMFAGLAAWLLVAIWQSAGWGVLVPIGVVLLSCTYVFTRRRNDNAALRDYLEG